MNDERRATSETDEVSAPEDRERVTTEGEHAINGGTDVLGGGSATLNGAGTSGHGMAGGNTRRDNPENTLRAMEKARAGEETEGHEVSGS